MTEDEEFQKDLMETFRQEAEEHVRTLSTAVVDLERVGGQLRCFPGCRGDRAEPTVTQSG